MRADFAPQVIVVAGPNGAGKSTLAPFFLRDVYGLTEFVNADTIAQGLSAFSPEGVALEAGRIMLTRLRALAERRANFAFETTLATRSYHAWVSRLLQQGYIFHLLFLWLDSPELAVQRVRERVRMGGHDVPEDVVRRRYAGGVKNFFRLYQPLAVTWGIFDNSVSGVPQRVAWGGRGQQTEILLPMVWQRMLGQAHE